MSTLACYINMCIGSYVCDRCSIYNRRSRGIFYLIYRIAECGVRCHWRLFVTIIPALIYEGYLPRTVVYCGACCAPGAVSACCTCNVFAISMCCGAWSAPGAVSACCSWYMCYVLWCLERTLSKRGVALVKFQTFPMNVKIFILW